MKDEMIPDKPVALLSTRLPAQENTTCNPNAHVTSYSIRPGSAYTLLRDEWGQLNGRPLTPHAGCPGARMRRRMEEFIDKA